MGLHQFLDNPKTYLKGHHEVRISQNAATFAAVRQGPALPVPGGGQSRQYYDRPAGPYVTLVPWMGAAALAEKTEKMKVHNVIGRHVGLVDGMTRSYNCAASAGDIGLRWLPYEVGFVTYMAVDGAATFMGTGELSGCTVGVGQAGGHIYYFHAFAPMGYHGVAARNIQRAMIDHIANGIGLNNMAYAENTIDYDGFAFGFGKKKGNHWKFYIYGTQSGVTKMAEY